MSKSYAQAAPSIGFVNYLLKRDLDPSAKDNAPMWVNEAA
jgi:hypothetical protein